MRISILNWFKTPRCFSLVPSTLTAKEGAKGFFESTPEQ